MGLLLLVMMLQFYKVEATTFSDYLPGGINYLDINNVIVENNSLVLEDLILVKSATDYTLSLPGFEMLGGNIEVYIFGENIYLNGNADSISNCIASPDEVICHFTTSETETHINIEIIASDMDRFYSFYGIENFQLQEGLTATPYEEYVIPLVDTTNPEFNGSGAFITSYQAELLIEDIVYNHIQVYDEVDGDLSNSIVILEDNYSSNKTVIGAYDVMLSVSDLSGNTAYFILTVLVKDEISPIINVADVIEIDVDEDISLTDVISSAVTYYDDYDQSTVFTILEDGFTANKATLGTYNVTIQVTDSSLNETTVTFAITVRDYDAPTLVSESVFYVDVDNSVSVNDIITLLEVVDNYDSGAEIIVNNDDYTLNKETTGIYFVDVSLQDSSGNSEVVRLTIHVEDYLPPVVMGPSTMQFSYENAMTIQQIKELYVMTDNYDVLTVEDIVIVSDLYSNREVEIGEFTIQFSVSDDFGNNTLFQLTVTIFDDVAPIIFIDEYIIAIESTVTFTESDALRLLIHSGELTEGDYQSVVLINEYLGNEKNAGKYLYQIMFTSEDGTEYLKDFVIDVSESENNGNSLIARGILVSFSIIIVALLVVLKKRR